MSVRRKQLNKVLVSMLSRVIIILIYVLKALIIPNGVFKLKINMYPLNYGPGVDSASNRNEYQVYFLGVKVAGA
jgi:hypothetical protein